MSEEPDTSYISLLAAGKVIGRECIQANTQFIICKKGDENPAACLDQGEKVTGCVLKR